MTEYLGLAVAQLRGRGRRVDDELLAHVPPAHGENIGLFGTSTSTSTSTVDVALARLGPTGHRSLRPRPQPTRAQP